MCVTKPSLRQPYSALALYLGHPQAEERKAQDLVSANKTLTAELQKERAQIANNEALIKEYGKQVSCPHQSMPCEWYTDGVLALQLADFENQVVDVKDQFKQYELQAEQDSAHIADLERQLQDSESKVSTLKRKAKLSPGYSGNSF